MSIREEIQQSFERASKFAKPSISHDQCLDWMRSDDIEVLSFIGRRIRNPEYFSRIAPEISFDEYKEFFLRYYGRCIKENPQDKDADSRYQAGLDLAQWFAWLWKDSDIPRSALVEIRDWLADLYRSSNEGLRIAIVHATLEHLFEDDDIAKFFDGWRKDSILSQAHADARAWVDGLDKAGLGRPLR